MKFRAFLKPLAMPIALVAICAFFAMKEPAFLGARNLTNLMIEFSIVATLALGAFLVILPGHIDLSVGSGVGMIGGIAAVLVFHHSWSAPAAMGAAFVVAVALWAVMGALIIKERIPAFIITLAGLLVFKGAFWLVIDTSTVPVSRGDEENLFALLTTSYVPAKYGYALAAAIVAVLAWLHGRTRTERRAHGLPLQPAAREWLLFLPLAVAIFAVPAVCNQFRGVPLSFVILAACAAGVQFLTQQTPFGRYLYAIGGNEEAAVVSGIAVERVVIGAFALMGVLVAVTGFMAASYQGSSTSTVGDQMELDAIAACVIGGTSLKGGRGTVWGAMFGALIMTVLLNGMGLMGLDPAVKFIARGLVLALAVWLDVRFTRD